MAKYYTVIFNKNGITTALSILLTLQIGLIQPGAVHATNTLLAANTERAENAFKLAVKVVEANGGIEALKRFNSTPFRVLGNMRHFSSISSSENTFQFQSEVLGSKQRISMDFMGQELVTGFDGELCWSKQGNNILPADPLASARIKEEIEHGLLLLDRLLDPGRELRLLSAVQWKGKKCEVLVVKADDGKETRMIIDPKTFLVLRSEFEGADQEQGTACLKGFEYFNYQTVSGTKQPARTIEYSDLKKVSEVTIKSYESAVNLPADYFSMPASEKIARLQKGPVEVPFIYSNNQILVKVRVNGARELLFLLDSGATQTIIDSQKARELSLAGNLKTGASKDISITTGSGFMKMHSVQLETLELGELKLENVSIAAAKLQSLSTIAQLEPVGLLGANILKRFLISIDYDRQVVCFSDPDNVTVPENAIVLETKPSLGIGGLALEGSIDDGPKMTFLVDTGAAFNHVSSPLIKDILANKEKIELLPVGTIKGLDGKPVSTGAVIFDKLKIGKFDFGKPVFSISTAKSTKNKSEGLISGGKIAILGNPFFSRYRMSIDYRNQRIFLEKTPQKTLEDSLLEKIGEIVTHYRADCDGPSARSALQKIQQAAQSQKQMSAAAMAMAYEGLILGYENKEKTMARKAPAKDTRPGNMIPDGSIVLFSQAYDLAMRSKSKKTAANVLSLWCEHLLENFEPGYYIHASSLISEAMRFTPNAPYPVAALGLYLLRQHASGDPKSTLLSQALELVNQALMQDPSNWIALKTKLELARIKADSCSPELIQKQIKTYYPGAKII